MTTRVLLRDIKDSSGRTKWPAGAILDLHPNVWAGICDQLGVTLGELSGPASDASPTETANRIAELEAEIADLKAELAELKQPASAPKKAPVKAATKKG